MAKIIQGAKIECEQRSDPATYPMLTVKISDPVKVTWLNRAFAGGQRPPLGIYFRPQTVDGKTEWFLTVTYGE